MDMTASLTVYYDGDCPFCSRYTRYTRLKESAGTPELVDIRKNPKALRHLQAHGFNPDAGMVVRLGNVYYSGSEALHILACLSTSSGLFNRINKILFSSKPAARFCYPVLRAGRNLTLAMLDRASIQPPPPSPAMNQYAIFAFIYGILGIIHSLYASVILQPAIFSTFTFFFSLFLVMNPLSKRWFILLVCAQCADAWLHAPIGSNHAILHNFLLLGILCSGIWHGLKGSGREAFYQDFAPLGRSLLLMMYFYGIFHKINTGFINPDTSCATTLMQLMPLPGLLVDTVWFRYLGIGATFLIEGLVILCLVVRRWSHTGITIGLLFHYMLATSIYAYYPVFSTLSFALHSLFLSGETLPRFRQTPLGKSIFNLDNRQKWHFLAAIWIILQSLALWSQNSVLPVVLWSIVALPFMYVVITCGKPRELPEKTYRLHSRLWLVNLLILLAFLNGMMPYTGIKTRQSLNMFANLRLEGGESNHLIMRGSLHRDGYLNDLVKITRTSPSVLQLYLDDDLYIVYYELLGLMERDHSLVVSFVRDGKTYEQQSYDTLRADADAMLHSRWIRKWLHFTPVDLRTPKPCALDR